MNATQTTILIVGIIIAVLILVITYMLSKKKFLSVALAFLTIVLDVLMMFFSASANPETTAEGGANHAPSTVINIGSIYNEAPSNPTDVQEPTASAEASTEAPQPQAHTATPHPPLDSQDTTPNPIAEGTTTPPPPDSQTATPNPSTEETPEPVYIVVTPSPEPATEAPSPTPRQKFIN